MSIDLLLSRIREGALELSPDRRCRAGIWSDEVQSKLIESLLIRIPQPAFYIDATFDIAYCVWHMEYDVLRLAIGVLLT